MPSRGGRPAPTRFCHSSLSPFLSPLRLRRERARSATHVGACLDHVGVVVLGPRALVLPRREGAEQPTPVADPGDRGHAPHVRHLMIRALRLLPLAPPRPLRDLRPRVLLLATHHFGPSPAG